MHSHIIPGVDDGSRSVEETFNMIKEAKEAGFTDLILTSHYYLVGELGRDVVIGRKTLYVVDSLHRAFPVTLRSRGFPLPDKKPRQDHKLTCSVLSRDIIAQAFHDFHTKAHAFFSQIIDFIAKYVMLCNMDTLDTIFCADRCVK